MRVRCVAKRVINDGYPPFVEAYLTDAAGFAWQLVDKTVMFHEWQALEAPDAELPMEVTVICSIAGADTGDDTVDIWLPEVSDRLFRVGRLSIVLD